MLVKRRKHLMREAGNLGHEVKMRFIYLLEIYLILLLWGRRATVSRGKNEKKKLIGQKAKPSTLTQAIDAPIGDEEQNVKQKKRKDRETRKSRSEEKVVGFSSTSLFPTRKQETVTQGGTI